MPPTFGPERLTTKEFMNTTLVLTVTACLLIACVVYFFMEFRAHGDRDKSMSEVLSVQAKLNALDKKVTGYARFIDHLAAGHKSIAEQAKTLTIKVAREYVHVEKMPKEKCKDGVAASIVLKYAVEYAVGIDLRPESFEVLATTVGIDVRTTRPGMIGLPAVKPLSHEVVGAGVLLDEPAALSETHDRFRELALRYGAAVALEETTRALCRLKLQEHLHNFLVAQPGVANVPVISVAFK